MSLKDKSALVTGGANGIGKSTVRALLNKGCKVNIVDIMADDLEKTLHEFQGQFGEENVTSSVADVTSDRDLRSSFDHSVSLFGGLDIVINNAGIAREGQWEKMVQINLRWMGLAAWSYDYGNSLVAEGLSLNNGGVVRGTDLAVEFMSATQGGVIVNISSISGTEETLSNHPFSIIPVYSASKAGVLAFSRCMAASKEVHEKRIRICCLCPINTVSNMTTNVTADTSRDEQVLRAGLASMTLLSADLVGEKIVSLVEQDDVNGLVAVTDSKGDLSFYK